MTGRSLPQMPALLETVRCAEFISPSMISPQAGCVLRRQGRTIDGGHIEGLIDNPWSIVGRLVHRAIQIADGRSNIVEVFEELVQRADDALRADERRRHFAPLKKALGEGAWAQRRLVIERRVGSGDAFKFVELGNEVVGGGGARVERGQGAEFWLESAVLGLRGSADLVELVGDGTVRITEWKTGSVYSEDGQVRPEYRLQLAAYQLLAKEKWPGLRIETWLFNGDSLRVKVTPGDEMLVKEAVAKVREIAADGRPVLADSLALRGAECAKCQIRNRCGAFFAEFRDGGRDSPDDRGYWSGDVTGRVEKVIERAGTLILNLRLPDRSVAQIRCDSSRFGECLREGIDIAAFGFIPLVRRDKTTGKISAPIVYEEATISRRSWQAEIYLTR